VAHAEKVTISEQALQGGGSGPVEVSDVRWYRAVGYSHILKQQGAAAAKVPTSRGRQSPGGGLASRAAAAYQKTMGSEGSSQARV
jgi:hypothetical protein